MTTVNSADLDQMSC